MKVDEKALVSILNIILALIEDFYIRYPEMSAQIRRILDDLCNRIESYMEVDEDE